MRSYKAVVAAVVLALVLLAPLLGQMAKAAAYPQPGTGLVYTKLVTVNGVVTFDFNLTPAYQGAAAHIYLSANGLPNVYYGDVPITPAFSTTNVTAVVGSWPITATDVKNFIRALRNYSSTEDRLSNGATQETVVLHNLTTQGWALVYLKYSTSAPVQYGGSAPAIAAGPFNLTIRPTMEVTIKPLNNLSYVSLCLPTSQSAFLNITGTSAYASGLISSTVSNLASYSLTLLGSFANSTVSTKSVSIAFINVSKSLYYSQVFTTPVTVNYTSTPPSIGVKGTLNPTFAPPALTNSVHFSSGAVTSYFNISNFSLDVVYNKPITVVPASGTTYIEFFLNDTYHYGTATGTAAAVSFYVVNYTLSNYGFNPSTNESYGLFTPSPAAGTLNIFPSFQVTNENPAVAGPTNELNPGDLLNITFYNLPAKTSLMITHIIYNNSAILPTTYFYPYEENVKSYYTAEGYYIVTSVGTFGPFSNLTFTNKTYLGGGKVTVGFVIPNAPYYPAAELGLEFEINYTAEYVSGNVTSYADVSNCELQVTVYPFYQVFTSNANGNFIYNGTTEEAFLFGNYLLVRGFGFSTSITPSEYPAMANPQNLAEYTTLTPITSVQTDGYGDFAYISQVPISGPFYNYLVTQIPTSGHTPVPASVVNPTFTSIEGNATSYEVYLIANPDWAIVYVNPTPVVYPPTPLATGLLGEIQLPTTLFKYPYEATQYMINGTTYLIPASEGMINEIVVVGAGANANITTGMYGSVLLKFYIEGYPTEYFGSVNVSQVAPFGDSSFSGTWVLGGYGVFYDVPVPDLPGNAGWMPSGMYPYEIVITNVTGLSGAGESGPAYTTLYVGKAADLLIGTYSLAYMLTNPATGAAEFYVSPLVTQPILVLPGTPVTAYVFGSPISKPTGEALPVNVSLLPPCSTTSRTVLVGYIINGTLWSNFTGVLVKGSTLTAGTTLPLCSGLNVLSGQIRGPYVPTGGTVTYPPTPVSLYLNYISVIPAYPVQFTLTAPGSVDAGTALEVLVSSQVSVMGLPAYQVSPFFMVSAPMVKAYVVTSSGVAEQLPVSLLTTIPDEYYVYLVSVPSNVSGTLIVEATVTATYIFTGQQFVGQQAAAVGILPPVNMAAISSIVSQAVQQIEANVTGEISQVESNMATYYGQLSQQLTTTQQTLATYILGNATKLLNSIESVNSTLSSLLSSLAAQLSGQITTAQQTLSGYMAGNFSELLNSITTAQHALATYMAGNFSALASQITTAQQTLSGYMAGNFSELLNSITTAQHALATYMAGNFSELLNSITSLNSALMSVNSTLMSLAAQLSGQITTAQHALATYMAGNFSALASQISAVQQALSSSYTLLSLQQAAVKQTLATYIAGNSSEIQTALSSLGVQLSGQITTAQHALATYMAGNFSAVLKYLSSVNSTLSTLGSDVSQLSTITSNLEGVASQLSSINTYMAGNFSEIESSLSSISSYMASNFSSISSSISTLEGDVAAVGGEVGSVGANVLELMKSVNTLTSYETAALNYLTSMNSTLGSVSSTLSSVSSTLSSVSSTVSSMSSTLSGVSSSLGTISSDLSTIGSDLSSMSGTLSSMSGTLSSVSSTVSSMSSQLSSMSSTLSSTSSTASNAYTEATHAAQLAASAATYSLAALIVAIIALALIAYVAFAKM